MAGIYRNLSTGAEAVEGRGVYPVGQARDGRTLYSDGSSGWSKWTYVGDTSNPKYGYTPSGTSALPTTQAQPTTSQGYTSSEALAKGLDINKLREQGLLIESQNPLEAVNQTIQQSFQELQNEVIKRFGEYKAGQPFRVDEVLAEKTKLAAEQIDPYYNQILGDYLLGVTRKINRGVDDTRDLLGELNQSVESYSQTAQNTLFQAVEKAEQGFAEAGLFQSGEQLRTGGLAKQEVGQGLSDYLRKAGLQEKQLTTGLARNIEDINLEKKGYVSDLERQRFTETQARAGQLTKEAGQQYIQGFQAVLPPQLQAASGVDLLKSLGIYS